MNLLDKLEDAEYYIKKFATWEASEHIIDDKKAYWCIKKPNSNVEKVCLFRDGCNMFVYGDYGQFTFDSMTWLGTVYNLEYNNIGYQMEKLSYESKNSLKIHDETVCEEDIYEWLKERLDEKYETTPDIIAKVIEFLKNSKWPAGDIDDFCEENKCDELVGIIEFADGCLRHTDEYEWITFLRNTDFSNYDEECESSLWTAGKTINQRYFICMYALQVCGEKLEQEKSK